MKLIDRVVGLIKSWNVNEENGYSFTDKESQMEALEQFLQDQVDWAVDYETSHEDVGNSYLEAYLSDDLHIIEDFLEESVDRYNESLREVTDEAIEAGVPKEKVMEVVANLVKAKPYSGINRQYDSVYQVSLGEKQVDLSNIFGVVNGKEVNDVFGELTSGLEKDDIGNIAPNDAYFDGNSLYINLDYNGWAFVVDPDELKAELDKLMNKNEAKMSDIIKKGDKDSKEKVISIIAKMKKENKSDAEIINYLKPLVPSSLIKDVMGK